MARYSWMMPIAELKMITRPKSESWIGAWAMIISAHIVPMTRLNEVKTFSRKMLARLRLLGFGAAFTCPALTRWATSAPVRPTVSATTPPAVGSVTRQVRPCGAG